MTAIAFLWALNEQDILPWTLGHLLSQGVSVHVFDNRSTDATPIILRQYRRVTPRLTSEVWPRWRTHTTVSYRRLLRHTEATALAYAKVLGPYWAIHYDADEIRRSQRPGETLLQVLERMRQAGWNAVDHRVEVFEPRDGYDGTQDPETYFTVQQEGHCDERNGQIKAWWQTPDVRVDLASSAGHRVNFPGRLVCPERLLLRHYPLRGEAQRQAKLARMERWDPEEKRMGWHVQYEPRVHS